MTTNSPTYNALTNSFAQALQIADFIKKQPKPITASRLNRLFWRDTRYLDDIIRYLIDSEQIRRLIYTEGEGVNARITTIYASLEVMTDFTITMRDKLLGERTVSPQEKLINYIQTNITHPHRDPLITLANNL